MNWCTVYVCVPIGVWFIISTCCIQSKQLPCHRKNPQHKNIIMTQHNYRQDTKSKLSMYCEISANLYSVYTYSQLHLITVNICMQFYGLSQTFVHCQIHCRTRSIWKMLGPSPLRAAARPNFTLPFTRCRYCRMPPLSHAAGASMSTTMTTTTTTTTRDEGNHYGPIEWAQLS